MPGYVSVDIVEFEDLGEQTKVRTRSLFFLPEERDGMLEVGHGERPAGVLRAPRRGCSRRLG